MKSFYKISGSIIILLIAFFTNSCNPFDDVYVKLALDSELNTLGTGSSISITSNVCLSDFDDYEDNKDNLAEIKYVSSAYFTLSSTEGLQGDFLTLRAYRSDNSSLLFEFVVPNFVAADYVNKPLQIELTQDEINNLNEYLLNPKDDKCFTVELQVSNVQPSNVIYYLNSKVQFLTEMKIQP